MLEEAENERHPLLETHDILGGLWEPADGDIDPSQITQAYLRLQDTANVIPENYPDVVKNLAVVGNLVYFTDSANFLWKTDGTISGTSRVKLCSL